MSAASTSGLTYDDLQAFPDDHLRRELIDGKLFVTPAPNLRHQHAVMEIAAAFHAYVRAHGGAVFPAPTDVYFAHDTVVEPDVVYVHADHVDRLQERFIRSAPDIVVEVSSPSTRRLDLGRKRALYEREGVAEFWFVDLDADRVELHVLRDGRYGEPTTLGPGEEFETDRAAGLTIAVADVLAGPH